MRAEKGSIAAKKIRRVGMIDIVSPEQRSWMMSNIRAKDTKPEMTVRKLVYGLGYRYRLHDKALPGKPDLVFKSRRKVIFVHGCFWHHHQGCARGTVPKSKTDFWSSKLKANEERDKQNSQSLISLGWNVLTVWECELKDIAELRAKIIQFLEGK